MRRPGLYSFMLQKLPLKKLKNTTVVIDAECIVYNVNKNLTFIHAFGCESDKIANCIKEYLVKFQKANLDCHFVFNGVAEVYRKVFKHTVYKKAYEAGDTITPLFIKDMWFQTLGEMGFNYVVCNGDHVSECIALALKLSCPLIGNNVHYFNSQVKYIPEHKTKLDKHNNLLCHIYTRSSFLEKYNMTEEKFILFITLSDQHLFNKRYEQFFLCNKILPSPRSDAHKFLENLINWLTQKSAKDVIARVNRYNYVKNITLLMQNGNKTNIIKLETLIENRKNTDTKMTRCVTANKCQFTKSDPDWFEKGTFCKYIPIPYIDLYKSKTARVHQENVMTLPIVQYAFDLLTNFKGKINFEKRFAECESPVPKPEYEATVSVFENGWEDIKQLKLFEHFVTETLQTFDFERLDKAPADCRLLLIALVFFWSHFSRKKPDVKLEVYSILLSYVMLSVVTMKLNKDDNRSKNTEQISERSFIDSFTDRDLVTATDCDIARSIMDEYFDFSNEELSYIFNCNRNALQPLTEFQHCLQELNNLNQLCGSQFDQTVYRKTYNGTFVYKILHAMKESGCQDGFQFIQNKLSPAPTILAFLSGILGVYESIYYDYC